MSKFKTIVEALIASSNYILRDIEITDDKIVADSGKKVIAKIELAVDTLLKIRKEDKDK
jgi:hypothetical protein